MLGLSVLSSLACTEYSLNKPTELPPEHEVEQTHDSDFPSLTACAFSNLAIPTDPMTNKMPVDMNLLCPIVLRTGSFGTVGDYVTSCTTSLQQGIDDSHDAMATTFVDNPNIWSDLINCKLDITVFSEITVNESAGNTPSEDTINDEIKMWLVPGYKKEDTDFVPNGVTGNFWYDNMYMAGNHERPLEEETSGIENSDSDRELFFKNRVGAKDASYDESIGNTLNLNQTDGYIDYQVNDDNYVYDPSATDPEYTPVPARPQFIDYFYSLSYGAKLLCDVLQDDFRGTKRCISYLKAN